MSRDSVAAGPLGWGIVAGGLLLAWGWLRTSQYLGTTILVESPLGAVSLYMALTFLPLMGIALLAGRLAGVDVVRAGANPGRWLLFALFGGVAALATALAMSWVNGGLAGGNEARGGLLVLLAGLLLIGLQAAAEELLFRGWLQAQLATRLGDFAAVGLAALAFALFHYLVGEREPLMLLGLLAGGVVYGLLALRSGGVLAPIGFHLGWSYAEMVLFGLYPNPGTGPYGAIFDIDLLGQPLWGGNEEGITNGIGAILVLLAVALPLAFGQRAQKAMAA